MPGMSSRRHWTPVASTRARVETSVAAVERDYVRGFSRLARQVERVRPARDEELRPEARGLLSRAAAQLVAGEPGGEAEIVLDARGSTGLSAARLAFDEQRAKTLRRAVDGARETRGTSADHDDVVLVVDRLDLKADATRDLAIARRDENPPVGEHDDGELGQIQARHLCSFAARRDGANARLEIRIVGREPGARDSVARQEIAQLV